MILLKENKANIDIFMSLYSSKYFSISNLLNSYKVAYSISNLQRHISKSISPRKYIYIRKSNSPFNNLTYIITKLYYNDYLYSLYFNPNHRQSRKWWYV